MDPLVLLGIGLALLFNFVNGANDVANSIATIVATRAITPLRAVLIAGACNFAGPFVLATAIAQTIGVGILRPESLHPLLIVVGLGSATVLVLVAIRSGVPLSSSHALVGGLLGAGIAAGGLETVILPPISTVAIVLAWGLPGMVAGALVLYVVARNIGENTRISTAIGGVTGFSVATVFLMLTGLAQVSGLLVIVLFIVISPALGFSFAFFLDVLLVHLFRYSRQNRMKREFRPLHVAAGGLQALAHGSNDGQHATGVIVALLLAAGMLPAFSVPLWVTVASAGAIAAGTCAGGWRVIEKVARNITKIRPYQGFAAAVSGGGIVTVTAIAGIPVSSTHAINGAVIGVGASRGSKAVRWEVVRDIITAWLITIPLAAVVSFVSYRVVAVITG
ncbi:MAG: inorganic phosphate transporter [Methanoregulaceae archaeon]|nr:inorganic phosphate transporter [Methanoregulaceae archaeon]